MALDADPFMRTRTRGSPSWPTASPEGRIRLCRLLRPADHKPLADGAGHTFWPGQTRCPGSPGSSRSARPREAAPAARDAGAPTRPPPANPATGASTTCPSHNPSPVADTPKVARCGARTGCRSAPPGPGSAAVRLSAGAVRVGAAGRSPPTGRRVQASVPSPVNAQQPVSLGALSSTLAISTGRGTRWVTKRA